MSPRALGFVAAGITTVSIAIVACSDATRPAPGGASSGIYGSNSSSSSSGASSGSSGGGEGGTDGATEGGPGGLCQPFAQLGEPVVETRLVGDPPAPLGGVIVDGTYILSSRNTYGATPSTNEDGGAADGGAGGDVKRATMVIRGATMTITSSTGPQGSTLPADEVLGLSFTLAGSTISATPICPTAGPARSIPYSAVGTGVALFVDPGRREVYVRQ